MDKIDCGSPFAPGRKGYIRFRDIPPELIALLNRGKIETATLTEQAAMDFAIVLREALRDWSGDTAALARAVQNISRHGLVKRMELAGRALGESGAFGSESVLQPLTVHPVDTVRGFACFAIALHPALGFAEKFMAIRPLAADRHFGVREWAWLALRPLVATAPLDAIALLNGWTTEADANLRRFAVEITRPRGVWAKHIPLLQTEPWRGLPLLEPCRRDAARYVQDSVANWLNDAARSQPAWVEALCREWLSAHADDPACRYISRRAQRNLIRR